MFYVSNNSSSILIINPYSYHPYTYDMTNAMWLHPHSFQTVSWWMGI